MSKDVLACFLDVKGVFDNVNSDILMKKLSAMGYPHNIVNLVSFLTHESNVMFVVSDSYTITRKVFTSPKVKSSALSYILFTLIILQSA